MITLKDLKYRLCLSFQTYLKYVPQFKDSTYKKFTDQNKKVQLWLTIKIGFILYTNNKYLPI